MKREDKGSALDDGNCRAGRFSSSLETTQPFGKTQNSGPSLFDNSSELTGWPNTIDADA
jgi:hypothetical protein